LDFPAIESTVLHRFFNVQAAFSSSGISAKYDNKDFYKCIQEGRKRAHAISTYVAHKPDTQSKKPLQLESLYRHN